MTNKISGNSYSIAISAAIIGMSIMANQAMASQDALPPPQEPVAVATEADASPPIAGSFEALDVNADASLSKEEIPAEHSLSKKFKKADTDKNGQLSKEEFQAYQSKNTK